MTHLVSRGKAEHRAARGNGVTLLPGQGQMTRDVGNERLSGTTETSG